eukprot:CAMPEP_0119341980 /NCGR_PEP_ID=MMETSP1333-20130426/103742_1 /TAXON_ID=418940 /ORGANISM="Scyphosphaera apsteinii, Strain RCC1455" /LENGTH=365 /DNA_ID=CAMNT_0007354093 /DNA_START=45 /DNA_END=1138 /DNA_ORIENTATION=+
MGDASKGGMINYADARRIGRGNYGTVFIVRDVRNKKEYCLKQILMEAYSDEERLTAQQEVEVLRTLDHPGIVRYHEHFVSEDSLCVVMAYCDGGDLAREIKRRSANQLPFQEAQVLNWFMQIVMALRYVHSKRILHRDLKTQNIFISGSLVKIGDFGIAKVMEGSMAAASTVIGTPYYMSPEVCQNQPYSYKSDVWALGCILYEMCALQQAWNGSNLLGLVYKIVQQKYPPLPDEYSKELKQLVDLMLEKEPERRPSLNRVLQFPFINNYLKQQLAPDGDAMPASGLASPSASPCSAASRLPPTSASKPFSPSTTRNQPGSRATARANAQGAPATGAMARSASGARKVGSVGATSNPTTQTNADT